MMKRIPPKRSKPPMPNGQRVPLVPWWGSRLAAGLRRHDKDLGDQVGPGNNTQPSVETNSCLMTTARRMTTIV